MKEKKNHSTLDKFISSINQLSLLFNSRNVHGIFVLLSAPLMRQTVHRNVPERKTYTITGCIGK